MNWTVVFALTAGLVILVVWVGFAAWAAGKVIDKYSSYGWGYVVAISVIFTPIILTVGLVA